MMQNRDIVAHSSDQGDVERALLAYIARSYYFENASKVEIAETLQISRFRVARLLDRALSEGVVTISINDDGLEDPSLSERLRDHLGLRKCTVIRCYGDEDKVRSQVGSASAHFLSSTLEEGEVLGLTWGRSLTATTERLQTLPRLTIVQLTGSVGGELRSSPVEVARQASQRSGGATYPIFSPLFIDDPRTAASLREHPDIKLALDLFSSVTTAVMSVGSWDPLNSQVPEVMPAADVERARARGCVADIAGILIGADGELIDPELQKRCISISYDQLKQIPTVIAVAAGAEKAEAIKAVTKAGLITKLVTDHSLAEAALEGDTLV